MWYLFGSALNVLNGRTYLPGTTEYCTLLAACNSMRREETGIATLPRTYIPGTAVQQFLQKMQLPGHQARLQIVDLLSAG